MPRTSKRPKLVITTPEREVLEQRAGSRTAPLREVQRARMLLRYLAGRTFTEISEELRTTRRIVYKCIDRALASGVEDALADAPHGSSPRRSVEALAWVTHLACSKPKDHGLAAELWTRESLARFVRAHAVEAGHPSVARVGKSGIHTILEKAEIRPHKIKYYLERRDPEFEPKMREVLMVYKEVAELRQEGVDGGAAPAMVTVSVDEKPGVQAIATTSPDLPPRPGRHAQVTRDHEYKRLGTASILAALDLHDGHVIARVERRHRSREFILLLKDLDAFYPEGTVIRVILDNHSAHISKETQAWLATRPNRFKYVHTPKHGSWLNLVETLFGKMARTFLKAIRVESWQELKERILRGINEINAAPVVHRWKNFDALQPSSA